MPNEQQWFHTALELSLSVTVEHSWSPTLTVAYLPSVGSTISFVGVKPGSRRLIRIGCSSTKGLARIEVLQIVRLHDADSELSETVRPTE